MPSIIRWFPVTHEINADPELWELREKFGDRAGFVWLEMLSIADRNQGIVGPSTDQTRNQLASKCRTSRVKVGLVLDWCRVKGWLVFDSNIRVANYSKYHKTREAKSLPSYPNLPNHPSDSYQNKNQEPARPEPAVDPLIKKSKTLDPKIKIAADAIYSLDTKRFARLIVWIKESQKHGFETAVIVSALERFQPYALNISDWYPYLDKLIYKAEKDFNRDQHEAEHNRHKEEIRELSHAKIN